MPHNILLLTADDMDGRTPGCAGGPPDATPTLDSLAAQGALFARAHVAIAVCQPSRSAILTGRWPHRNGAEGFEPIRDDVPVLNDLLRPAGYRTGILGKVTHQAPVARFAWDTAVDMRDLGMGRNPARYREEARRFIRQSSAAGRPWFLMANAHDPHRPFAGSDQERKRWSEAERSTYPAPSKVFRAGDVKVPGWLPPLPEVELEVAEYLSSARRADDVVAAVLDEVDQAGVADETLVVFLSDNGMAFPFAKSNCYLQSTLTPLIVRWPGKVAPGTVVADRFVSALDLFPLFCAAAGVEPPAGLDGGDMRHIRRDHVVTVYHETAGGRRYEMRCIQDAQWGYIWNAWSDGTTEYVAENMAGRTWAAMVEAARSDAAVAARTELFRHRVPEELYDLSTDPDGLHNLVGAPDAAETLADMRARLAEWGAATTDPLAERFRREVIDGAGGAGRRSRG